MSKPYVTVIIESIVIGILLVALFSIINYFIPETDQLIKLFVSGAIFHILCEVSGVNLWYVNNYQEILNK